jgi:hypothetical protein
MRKYSFIILSLLLVVALELTGLVPVAAPDELIKELSPLKPFIGKTWKGELKGSTPDKPVIDVSHWERALNGRAVRVLHSINNGEYGGESIITWDPNKKCLVYFYFTTGGFYTTGVMAIEDNKFTSRETVTGNAQGITEVKSISEILPDGRLSVRARYFQGGKWKEGHQVIYVEAPGAEVIFK